MEDKTRLDLVCETVKALRMNSCAYLSRSYVISAPLGPIHCSACEPDRQRLRAVSTVFSSGGMSGGDFFFCRRELNSFQLISWGQRCYRAPRATNLRLPTPPTHPCAPLYPTPPSSCCAPIKAELIKPQLIASAGGGRRRKKRWGGGGGVYNYTLAFTYHF